MTYEPNIPVGDLSPATQQLQVKTNFSQFPAIFSSSSGGINYNHTAINTSNQGKHETVILTQQTSDPVISTDYVALYAKTAVQAAGNALEVFMRIPQFNPTILNNPIQLTYNQVNTAGPQYQSFLPGGYIMYFGSKSGITTNANTLIFPITVSPTPSGNLTPIAATNTNSSRGGGGGGRIGCAISANVTSVNQFTIYMESPYSSLNPMAPYILTWVALAQV
jgi:hypothetical protein